MNQRTMTDKVQSWLDEQQPEMQDLQLDGSPYYDEDLGLWRQDAEDASCTYAIVAYGEEIRLEYTGTK